MRYGWVLLLVLGCDRAPTTPPAIEPALRFDGMGDHTRKVSTKHALAQEYFDQGLVLAYGFNHQEAAESFRYAATLDPECAMAHWGEAYALGPYYNLVDPEADSIRRALAALERAKDARATPVERGLTDALAKRYADPPPKDRTALNQAYADAMGELWRRFPDDDDVGTLYADALMNLNPWTLWTKDGKALPRTDKIVAALEQVLERNPNHPGAIHLYIHAVEPSPHPERAEAAADRLAGLVPGSAHLVHMPAHIFVRLGRYRDAVETNRKAVALDRAYFARKKTDVPARLHFSHAHNNHFLAWSAMYAGRYEDAVLGCKQATAAIPDELRDDVGAAEYLASIVHVYIRFGRWEDLLAAPPPPSKHPLALALHHYGRGVACANTGRFDQERREAEAFERFAAAVPPDTRARRIRVHDILAIARQMLAGEAAFLAGEQLRGLNHLRRAVELEDRLSYQEPSSWMMPTRHALGALLLDANRVEEAEAVYRKDLERHAENGWALHGLARCLERLRRADEAAAVRRRFATAWEDATVTIQASCFCARAASQPAK
ncbi:MAG: hypothetical protein OER88_06835 [Planctomycetota bacterium]|nr:hypothetical protein [Planctomycetota bacterium]